MSCMYGLFELVAKNVIILIFFLVQLYKFYLEKNISSKHSNNMKVVGTFCHIRSFFG